MTTIPALPTSLPPAVRGPAGRAIGRHPVLAASGLLIGVTWLAQIVTLVAGWPTGLALVVELAAFVVVPLALSAAIGGRREVRRLLSGFLRVRIGLTRWLLALLAMPVLTIGVALVTGTYVSPPEGWASMAVTYVAQGLLLLGVTGNMAEEAAWSGFVQSRLMNRHGPVVGSLLTAIPFSLIHLPLAFDERGLHGTPWTDVALTWAVLVAVAPALRLLVGFLLVDTRGSLLAVGFLHAAFNASGRLSVVGGGWWQNVVALIVLTLLVAGWRRGQAVAWAAHRSGPKTS
ncbi:MAG: Abortive infection protein [Friedmanniella sp.]|nr:Abortive infection protein [Friedmanniella sp.]